MIKLQIFSVPGLPKTDKKKAKDPLKPHNYEDLFDEESEAWRTVEKTTRINKKPVQLQNKTMVNWSEERLLLPADLNYRGKDFAQLFVTPELLVTNKGKTSSVQYRFESLFECPLSHC